MKLNFMTVIQFFFSALRYYADDELKWLSRGSQRGGGY